MIENSKYIQKIKLKIRNKETRKVKLIICKMKQVDYPLNIKKNTIICAIR